MIFHFAEMPQSIPSPVDGCLGCFQGYALVLVCCCEEGCCFMFSSPGVHMQEFLLDIYLEMGWLEYVNRIYEFQLPYCLFFKGSPLPPGLISLSQAFLRTVIFNLHLVLRNTFIILGIHSVAPLGNNSFLVFCYLNCKNRILTYTEPHFYRV